VNQGTTPRADRGWGLRGRLVPGAPGAGELPDAVVWIHEERIAWCGPAEDAPADLAGAARRVPLILPGLVDVHCHGARGETFGEDVEGARIAAGHHAAHGTTSLFASLVSAPPETLLRQIEELEAPVRSGELAGIHLEGPFLAEGMCGAQDPAALIPGDPGLLEGWLRAGRGTIRSITLAPETAQAARLVELCREHGVVPSIGHSEATDARLREVMEQAPPGPWSGTHLFNRIAPLTHREPGPIPVLMRAARDGVGSPPGHRAAEAPPVMLELIPDGVHVEPELIRWMFSMVGPGAIALVTDAMAAAGMPDGRYALGSMDVTVADGEARLSADTERGEPGALAGGTSRLIDGVRNCVAWGIPLPDAVAAASSTPARTMGLAEVGELAPGRRADLVVTDGDLRVLEVHRAGRLVAPEPARTPPARTPTVPVPSGDAPARRHPAAGLPGLGEPGAGETDQQKETA
jgi:N-acetylglucosamine-6-phosphate deacetylase